MLFPRRTRSIQRDIQLLALVVLIVLGTASSDQMVLLIFRKGNGKY